MAILQIIDDTNETLRKKCREVSEITPRILTLLDDMADTLHKANGAGLAAPQVGVLRRVVLVETEPGQLYELINPKIVESEGEQCEVEGCLSLPGQWGYTKRPMKVTVEALNRKGETVRYTGEGLLARAFCHELDHLDGVLFKDNSPHMLTREEIEEYFSE
ncbi:MAG: peptide deformylase [Clostridia bacterium]|nr:peptide deformylase [Clostridia bacterium]